jgi:5-(carboxyamino)imidazole ribonucleotide mutase
MSRVLIVMGSKSDWDTMRHASETLDQFGIAHEKRVASAHRAPMLVHELAGGAEARGIKAIIAAAGGAAHLAGVVASMTTLPVLGVPMDTKSLGGLDSLLSTVQMPAGIPVATFAIGEAGAKNAAIFAAHILSLSDETIGAKLKKFREDQTKKVMDTTLS